jgi:hypothetical protein
MLKAYTLGTLYYVDTDSIHTDVPDLAEGAGMGSLRLEKYLPQVYYVGVRAYIIASDRDKSVDLVMSGLPVKRLTHNQWRDILSGKKVPVVYSVGTTVFGLVRTGQIQWERTRIATLGGTDDRRDKT